MSKKGGYQIIDLKNQELTTLTSLTGVYDAIEGNYYKPILLSGIVINGVEKADVYTIPTLDGTKFVLKDIYGYDITIESDDDLSVKIHFTGTPQKITLTKNEDGYFEFPVIFVGNRILIYEGSTLLLDMNLYLDESEGLPAIKVGYFEGSASDIDTCAINSLANEITSIKLANTDITEIEVVFSNTIGYSFEL